MLSLYRPVLRRILRGASRIIAGSDNYIASSPYLKPLASNCTVIPYAVDPDRFDRAAPLYPPVEQPTLLFVGRHRYYKGVDDLIRAASVLPVRLLLGGDGPMREEWETLASRFGVTDRVLFVGTVADADLPGLYASADIFVLPANSRAEAFGKVLLEAMASSLPCVTTELGTGTSFVVRDGVSGFVVPPHHPEALAAALERLLSNPALRRTMGEAGRARVLREFTPEVMVHRVGNVYDQVAAQLSN